MTDKSTNIPKNFGHLKEIEFDLNSKKREVYFNTEVDLNLAVDLKQRFDYIVATDGPKKPITLYISSFGGMVYGMMGAIDLIRNYPVPINTVGTGAVMSAAVWLLASATGTRAVTANTDIMVHRISSWFQGNSLDIDAEAKSIKRLQTRMYDLLAAYSNKKAEFWKNLMKTNIYLSPEECRNYALVDKII